MWHYVCQSRGGLAYTQFFSSFSSFSSFQVFSSFSSFGVERLQKCLSQTQTHALSIMDSAGNAAQKLKQAQEYEQIPPIF